jgi:regulator of replication initiation timing
METLISLHPKTAEEKLLFANSYIAELLEENKRLSLEKGILQSDLDELKHQMKQEQLGALILKQKNQAELIQSLGTKIRRVKQDNENLIIKIAQLQLK